MDGALGKMQGLRRMIGALIKMEECLGVNANDYIGEGGTLQLQLLETEVGLEVGIVFSNKHLREGLTLAYF